MPLFSADACFRCFFFFFFAIDDDISIHSLAMMPFRCRHDRLLRFRASAMRADAQRDARAQPLRR